MIPETDPKNHEKSKKTEILLFFSGTTLIIGSLATFIDSIVISSKRGAFEYFFLRIF